MCVIVAGEIRILIGVDCANAGPVEFLGPGLVFKRDNSQSLDPDREKIFIQNMLNLQKWLP